VPLGAAIPLALLVTVAVSVTVEPAAAGLALEVTVVADEALPTTTVAEVLRESVHFALFADAKAAVITWEPVVVGVQVTLVVAVFGARLANALPLSVNVIPPCGCVPSAEPSVVEIVTGVPTAIVPDAVASPSDVVEADTTCVSGPLVAIP
jgi:hypothetical protein